MRHAIQFLFTFVFILCTAMTCEDDFDDYDYTLKSTPCRLTDINLYHINNEGSLPLPANEKVKKDAYMLAIELITEKEEFVPLPSEPSYSRLREGITRISIICENSSGKALQAGKDISDYFQDYPLPLLRQKRDSTLLGDTIYNVDNNIFYKALTKHSNAGIYGFKVVITLTNGTVIEKKTSKIELY